MLIGYARVSTEDQNLDLQRDALKKAGVDPGQIYEEHVSGAKAKRPELTACLRTLREDDTLVIWRLDRLGRSVPDLIKILDQLKAKGTGLRSLSDNFDTTTAMGIMVFHMLATFAQFERDLVSERTKAGLKAARDRGKRGGRPSKLKAKDVRMIKQLLKDKTVTKEEIAKRFGVSRATVHRSLLKARKDAEVKELDKLLKAQKRAAKAGAR